MDTWAPRRLRRRAQSCPGWSYDEVLPYFQRAERRKGSNTGGYTAPRAPQFISELRDPNLTTSAFLAACAELGMCRLGELNEPDNTGYGPTPVTQRRGLRHSAADAYLRPAMRRRNLTILTGAHAIPVLRRGMLTSNKCEAVAFVRSDPPLAAPDYELIWFPVPFLDGA
jgi:choline dehydrogenase